MKKSKSIKIILLFLFSKWSLDKKARDKQSLVDAISKDKGPSTRKVTNFRLMLDP